MSRLDEFLRLLCGRFDNTRQLEELRRSGSPALPLAEHVNTVCNDKIDGLPADFAGAFVLEESYYTTEGKTHASPHLFLFTEEGEAVKLTSYQLPKAADGGAATYETLPPLKWEDLEISIAVPIAEQYHIFAEYPFYIIKVAGVSGAVYVPLVHTVYPPVGGIFAFAV